jgi:hypothetical protein
MSIAPLGTDTVVRAQATDALEPESTPAAAVTVPADAPAGDPQATANARDRLGVESTIRATKTHVAWLDTELARLETNNEQLYRSSQATIQQMQNELAPLLSNRRVDSDTRVSAFMTIAQNSQRLQRLQAAWTAHRAKQAELGATLAALKETERNLSGPDTEMIDARLVLFQRRVAGLEALLANLERQVSLLREMVAQASGTGRALEALQLALDASVKETRAWIERARGEAADDLLARVLDVAGFAAMLVLPPAAFATMTPLIGLLKDLVKESPQPIENFVWSALGGLATRALLAAGVGELAARAIVAALREGGGSTSGSGVADAIAGVALTEAQAWLIDFLGKKADPSLPVGALARAVIALRDLSRDDAQKIAASLSARTGGVDAALAMLETAAR